MYHSLHLYTMLYHQYIPANHVYCPRPSPTPFLRLGASVSSDGCADGSREGLDDIEVYRRVAACGASWNIPGVVQGTRSTAGCQKNGVGCSVHDAWYVSISV
eukprot:TRINITY_DN8938_c0_g1_i1.p1 TRINITY_DN8938_c0_g1~~TRINITY_DN8938_c0_g1_i1.p1  ORF type:complete len:102 (+),score=0.24 TRINITY_DN8938_c0_g1_i1:420-725(+)